MKTNDDLASRILIVNCWHDSNKGDAAITIGIINALAANGIGSRVMVASYVAFADEEAQGYAFRHVLAEHPEVEVVPTAVPALASSVGTRDAIKLACRGLLKLIFPRFIRDLPMESAIRKSSAVVSNGGLYFGFVRGSFGNLLFHLFAFSYPMLFARRVGVPYFLYAQSFGPFHGWCSRWWMRRLIGHSVRTWSRESYSQNALLNLGAKDEKLEVVADAAFGINPWLGPERAGLQRYGLDPGNYVVLSLRELRAAGHDRLIEANYLAVFRNGVEWLVREKGLRVVLLAHTMGPLETEDDRTISAHVWNSLDAGVRNQTLLIVDDLGPTELAQLYGAAKFVIATRFHAVVLAVCGGSPVVAIPYFGLKTQGSLSDMGLSDSLIELESLTLEALQAKSNAIIEGGAANRSLIEKIAKDRFDAAMETGTKLRRLIGSGDR